MRSFGELRRGSFLPYRERRCSVDRRHNGEESGSVHFRSFGGFSIEVSSGSSQKMVERREGVDASFKKGVISRQGRVCSGCMLCAGGLLCVGSFWKFSTCVFSAWTRVAVCVCISLIGSGRAERFVASAFLGSVLYRSVPHLYVRGRVACAYARQFMCLSHLYVRGRVTCRTCRITARAAKVARCRHLLSVWTHVTIRLSF